MNERISQLSDAQRTCLRLVALNLSSKEIAQQTKLSPQTVDQYLSKAAALLGASNRREAARLLLEWEDPAFNKSEFKPNRLASAENSPSMTEQVNVDGGQHGGAFWLARQLPPLGGKRHDLEPTEVLYAILRVSLFTMGAAGAIIAVVIWLNRLAL
ncbi:MAG: helix-turn-helix transcriptional regulator [Sphingobium sp.]|jgi:DNA-binding CsgD family transcriptional regulator|nr:helix-turn-helix transcriptional regulator [Sphingobium sp.]MCI1271246.1 helix-turn-helix transcriptional regulator [Sphingobium sp.]MCI1756062.1 helix-turn-helix transcriptional regulator [Sphingobium sp.]MCI2052637.1 helix-turn-helix transcriptional regulator [Sphingobium sp.]